MPACAALPKCYAAAVERSGRRLMIHANLVDSGVFFGVAALTLLLMMFLYAVITADPEEAARTEASLTQSAVLPPPALPARGAQTLAPPVFPRVDQVVPLCGHLPAAASATSRRRSPGSRRKPAAVLVFPHAAWPSRRSVEECSSARPEHGLLEPGRAITRMGSLLHTAQLPGGAPPCGIDRRHRHRPGPALAAGAALAMPSAPASTHTGFVRKSCKTGVIMRDP
jgi:hypothetical protein